MDKNTAANTKANHVKTGELRKPEPREDVQCQNGTCQLSSWKPSRPAA